jgi:FkbM family methyltransferase
MSKNTLRQRLNFFLRSSSSGGGLSWLDFFVLNPLGGLLFDLTGGVYKTDSCRFVAPKEMSNIGWRGACFWRDRYEAEERSLIKQFLKPEDTVIELGACLGVVSCVTNRLLKDRSRHLVVEANPYLIHWLQRNRQLNQAGFLVEHCAVGTPPETTFYIHPTAVVDGSCQHQSDNAVRLPCRSLRELHERYGPFSALIMDIEGGEADVLEMSQDLIKSYRLAVIELHSAIIGEDKIARCKQILSNAGLQFAGRAGITEAWRRP